MDDVLVDLIRFFRHLVFVHLFKGRLEKKRVGFLLPLQGRSHQIKQLLTPGQKQFLQQWLAAEAPKAWEATDDHFKMLFELE